MEGERGLGSSLRGRLRDGGVGSGLERDGDCLGWEVDCLERAGVIFVMEMECDGECGDCDGECGDCDGKCDDNCDGDCGTDNDGDCSTDGNTDTPPPTCRFNADNGSATDAAFFATGLKMRLRSFGGKGTLPVE